ncbi:DUF4238 domain-containing protein [Crocosphaera chwakensis]|uniref:DUF4238 domain-containing protein n=1 Tax=Crocosphaera chwakensis CCY0110 TaxID=391612 RepID=A3IME2_9CHRO|nr:DUF4238 domain-containing protein [Crocosphaera chwakensis]EAZ92311.1 hypothetical protein CY0110_28169 [Crocosphaera chwakensis CCY0110]
MKKRRQHYVWRHYLEAWASNGNLWCHRLGKNVFSTSTQNVANERDFYRLREMSEFDLLVVKKLAIEPLASDLREIAEGWIPHFTFLFKLKRKYQETGSPEFKDVLDEYINNLEEDMLAGLEQRAIPFLESLRNEDPNLLTDAEKSIFHTWFLASQYFRTPTMLESMTSVLKKIPDFNAEASFGLMRTIFSCNVGRSLWLGRKTLRVTFLRANSIPFITGDQPMVNMKAINLEPGVSPQELELYYPVSPSLGVLFDFDAPCRSSTTKLLTTEEVRVYNQVIAKKSKRQIYGINRASIEDV